MAKIKDVVTLKSGYANFVELKSAFEEAQENADRIAMYRPTKAHRRAFERICRGLFQPTDKKFYLLSGSYGTGKSHLSLMTANVLSRSSGDPAIAGFYENYAKLDAEKAKFLKNIRKDGQYLVAICDYHSGQRFEDVVMKAVFDACAAKGLDAGVDTEFDEAERRLTSWHEQGDKGGIRNFYQDFGEALETVAPSLSVEQLRGGLKSYDSQALEQFRSAFRKMMGGIEFQAQSGNLIPILKNLTRSRAFKDRFKGLAVFFDEFGFTLEKANYSKDILQGFMETICKNEPNVMFIGCIHKDFKSYADRFSKDDAAVMSARITQVDLLNEGIEEIIAAIVETDKQSATWKDRIAPKTPVFDQLVPTCKALDLFPWIDNVDHIRGRVLEDIYGVHPMALSCLLKLSSEIGSDARSTFTFFSGDVGGEEGSYAEFIEKTDLTIAGGKLALYTADLLVSFFRRELSQRNPDLRDRQRQIVNGFYASIEAVRKVDPEELAGLQEDDRLKILKTILIYLLCQIPTSADNIQFGLYCLANHEKKLVESQLKDLVKCGAVFFRQQSKTYELAAGSGEDPYDLIERYLADTSLHPQDKVGAFLEEAAGKSAGEFLKAKSFNLPFTDDKCFNIRFVHAKDLGPKIWDEIRTEYDSARTNPSKSFEGTLVYALCEEESEISVAKEAARSIPVDNIALAVPHSAAPFSETLLKVRACRHYLSSGAAHKITAQTESRLRDIFDNPQDGYLTELKRTYTQIAEGGDACWYIEQGKILVDKPQQTHKAADMLCERLFTKRCRLKHADLNLVHDDRWKTAKNTALKQAVEVLLSAERVIIDNGNPDNHGEKRYLEKVLLKGAGALNKTGAEGRVSYFLCETNPDKIHDNFPALKELCNRLARLNPGQSLSVGPYLEDMRNAPYGVGGTALILSLSQVIRAYGERLNVYKDSTQMVEQPLRSYGDLVSLVSDPSAQTVFSVREISEAQISLVDRLARAVGAPELRHGERRSLQAAHKAIMEWYARLPAVAGIVTLHDTSDQNRLGSLKSLLDGGESGADHFTFLLERLPSLYRGGSEVATLTTEDVDAVANGFLADVKKLESAEETVRQMVGGALCAVFGVKGDMIECEKVVTMWYKSLNPRQRDSARYDEEDASSLLARLAQDSSFANKIAVALPVDYGFGAVADWTSLHVKDYAAKVKHAKEEIDKARTVVPRPHIKNRTYEIGENESVGVDMPKGAAALVYTFDGTDPRQSESASKADSSLDLAKLLNDQPNVKIRIRAVDQEGNYSDPVEVELVNKKHKYDLKITQDMYAAEASFKCPEDFEGFVAVLRSLLRYAVEKSLLTDTQAERIERFVRDLSRKGR